MGLGRDLLRRKLFRRMANRRYAFMLVVDVLVGAANVLVIIIRVVRVLILSMSYVTF